MGDQQTAYFGLYPSQWSEWDWNFEHSCYVRYRLSHPGTYEWDVYDYYTEPQPEPQPSPQFYTPDRYDKDTYSNYSFSNSTTSPFHNTNTTTSFSDSDRDSGYNSSNGSSCNSSSIESFDDLLDHPESWTVNPFLAYGFPAAKPSKHHHSSSSSPKSKSPRSNFGTFGSVTSRSQSSFFSDEGYSEPPPQQSWITLFSPSKSREVNISPLINHASTTHYISHSILKDLGLWDSRKMGRGKEEWVLSEGEGKERLEELVKIVGSWTLSWGVFKDGEVRGKGKGSKLTFKVFRDRRRRVVLGMSGREARKMGLET